MIFALLILSSVNAYLLDPLFIYLGIKNPPLIDPQECEADIVALKQELYANQEFTSTNVGEFNRLLNECNVNFFAVIREGTLFEQTQYESP